MTKISKNLKKTHEKSLEKMDSSLEKAKKIF